MQIFLFILDVTKSYTKYSLPSKTQGHTVISSCTRARQFSLHEKAGFSLIVRRHANFG